MEAVTKTKIEKLIPIFKDGMPANAIEVARITDCEFDIIVGKGLYKVGDGVVYIMPDYCIPDVELFREYYAPQGDVKKSKLGKRGRIRATKFNFHFENESDVIYSNGIILPLTIIEDYINKLSVIVEETVEEENIPLLQKQLGVIKYVAEDSLERSTQHKGIISNPIPSFLYVTDESRAEAEKKQITKVYEDGEEIGMSLKKDGSSITIYCKKAPIEEGYVLGICSRKLEKDLGQKELTHYIVRDEEGLEIAQLQKYYNKETKEKGWINTTTNDFWSNESVQEDIDSQLICIEPQYREVKDAWVDTVKKFDCLNKLLNYCKTHDIELALRGELIGQGNKGSGNKYNKDANGEARIAWFGIDDLSSGFAKRIHYKLPHNLKEVCETLGLEYCENYSTGHWTYEEMIAEAKKCFAEIEKQNGQIIEGVVFRTLHSNKLSVKYINPRYDERS